MIEIKNTIKLLRRAVNEGCLPLLSSRHAQTVATLAYPIPRDRISNEEAKRMLILQNLLTDYTFLRLSTAPPNEFGERVNHGVGRWSAPDESESVAIFLNEPTFGGKFHRPCGWLGLLKIPARASQDCKRILPLIGCAGLTNVGQLKDADLQHDFNLKFDLPRMPWHQKGHPLNGLQFITIKLGAGRTGDTVLLNYAQVKPDEGTSFRRVLYVPKGGTEPGDLIGVESRITGDDTSPDISSPDRAAEKILKAVRSFSQTLFYNKKRYASLLIPPTCRSLGYIEELRKISTVLQNNLLI